MPNTYSQISIQVVFAVKGRENIITADFRTRLYEYITGIIAGNQQKPLAVNGWKDHVHVFFGMQPTVCISDVVRDIKAGSSKWINHHHFVKGEFRWQDGFAAFSYSKSQRNSVIKYIIGQEPHHRSKTFREEYLDLLRKSGIEFSEKYLFEFYE
jgi:REP element-mobilizing transposase RayT